MDGGTPNEHTSERAGLVPNLTIPNIPELERVPQRIEEEDEVELRWFLGSPLVASIAQGSGSFGAQLERAEAYGYGALPCRTCGGQWRRRFRNLDGDEEIVDWRNGTGRVPILKNAKGAKLVRRPKYATALKRYRRAQKRELNIEITRYPNPKPELGIDPAKLWGAMEDSSYQKRGVALMTQADFEECFATLPDELTEPCSDCDGLGVVPRRNPGAHEEVTAWPKGSSVQMGSGEGLDADGIVSRLELNATGISDGSAVVSFRDLERWRAVASILGDVARVSELARVALEHYYSPPDHLGMAVEADMRAMGFNTARARRCGREALAELVPANFGPRPALRAAGQAAIAREVERLYTFACQAWNLAAYGAPS